MQVRALSEQRAGRRHPVKRDSVLDLVGGTPLVRLNRVTNGLSSGVDVWVKLEYLNPGRSVKDRAARQILVDALERGDLGDNRRLLDATTGLTGIAYAMLGASLGIGVTVVVPENIIGSRRRALEQFGAQIVTSSPSDGPDGAVRLARELAAEHPDQFWFANQHANPSNPLAHQLTTAPEIWSQSAGRVSHFVVATGSSGTLVGASRGLRAFSPDVQCFSVQPADKSGELLGLTAVEDRLRPPIYDDAHVAGTLRCEPANARAMAARLAREEGIAAGYSAGANVWAALQIAADLESGYVVTLISDHADHYFADWQ